MTDPALVLTRAEAILRAEGHTGPRAFEMLVDALRLRMGDSLDRDVPRYAVDAVAELPVDVELDLLGLAYERFFPDLFKGRHGQFFTPRPLIELLLARARVGPGEEVLDPTCGSGGFLVCAGRRGAQVRGIERDPLLADLARMNLRLAGVEGQVRTADFFAAEPAPVDVVVANPPFSVDITDPAVLERYALAAGRARVPSDWLFIEALGRWVRPGGRAAVVLPWSLATNSTFAPLRERIDADFVRTAVCALPEGVFRPFGGAAGRALLLWLRRRPTLEVACEYSSLVDPGYDVRSQALRLTDSDEVARLADGVGWQRLPPPAWVPLATGKGRRLGDFATHRHEGVRPSRESDATWTVIDLADADKATGEITSASRVAGRELKGARVRLRAGQVLVARLRPRLGNVAIARGDAPLVGSPEWIPLEAEQAHYLLHALRTPTWRAQVAVTEGQTRPRTSAEAVLQTRVPWPDASIRDRVHTLSQRVHQRRAILRQTLDVLQDLVDRFAAGDLDEAALDEALEALERGSG